MRLAPVALLEGGDAALIVEGEEVTLKNWGNVKVTKVDKDADGELLCFPFGSCSYHDLFWHG